MPSASFMALTPPSLFVVCLLYTSYDGNPANLYALPPVEAAKRYVELAGGADKMLDNAQKAFDKGDYRWTAEVLKHVVFADQQTSKARNLAADALEQLGYQAESGPWRNEFLVLSLIHISMCT